MRILIVTDQYPPMVGGVPNLTRGLAIDFASRGHQVWLIAPSSGARDVQRIEQGVHVYRFSAFDWFAYKGQRLAFLPFAPVLRLIKQCDPDIIHVHSPVVLGNIAQILAARLHKPVIATNHFLPMNMHQALASDPVLGKTFSQLSYSYLVHFYNRCNYFTSPTATALRLLQEHGLRTPAAVISNGIDVKRYSPAPCGPEVLQRFGLPEALPLILHVNRLSEEKRIDVLLEAVARMKMPAHVALVSTGPAEGALRALAERLQIQDRISFLGFVHNDDLLALRRLAAFFVIPSEADLQSMAMMEAMACGLPVIAADAYALPELVKHERNGFLFQPGDSDELATRMDQLLADTALHARMSRESVHIISAHDRFKVLEQWEELYTRLATGFTTQKRSRRFLSLV